MNKSLTYLFGSILFIIGVSFAALSAFLQVAPETTAEHFMTTLTISNATVVELTSLYFLSYAIMQIPIGILFDRFGIRYLLPLGILIVMLGSLLHWLNISPFTLGLSRTIIGIGCSTAFLSAVFVAAKNFPVSLFPILIGVLEFSTTSGDLIATKTLANFLAKFGWDKLNLFIAIYSLVLFIVSAIAALVPIRTKAHDQAAGTFHFRDLYQNLKAIFKDRRFSYTIVYSFFTWMALMSFAGYWGKAYFEHVHEYSALKSLEIVEFYWIGFLTGSLSVGSISNQLGNRRLLIFILACLGIVASLIFAVPFLLPFPLLILAALLIGYAAAGIVLSFSYINEFINPHLKSTAMAINNTAVILGGFTGQYLFGLSLQKWDLGRFYDFGFDSRYYTALLLIPLAFIFSAMAIKKAHRIIAPLS